MPLQKGENKATIRKNIEELTKTGRPHDQVIAIALDMAKKRKK
jgi:hypothetical protein